MTLSFEEIDDVIEARSWFGARLTILSLGGLKYSIACLPRRGAAGVVAALRSEADRLARKLDRQILERETHTQSGLSGAHYLRYGKGEELRRHIEQTIAAARSRIVRRHLGGEALRALDAIGAIEAATDFESERTNANRRFVSTAVPAVRRAMDESSAHPPTDEQAAAIATDEETTLVLAGAGTGKTAVITGKMAYLVRNCGVLPEQILVLAYNRKAAEEIHARTGDDLSGCEISTFHAFGRRLISQDSAAPTISRMATDPHFRSQQLDGILDEMFSRGRDAHQLLNFVAYHGQPYRSPFDFGDLSEYRGYTRSIELRTLNGDLVKSYEELVIANFLALNGVRANTSLRTLSIRRILDIDSINRISTCQTTTSTSSTSRSTGAATRLGRDTKRALTGSAASIANTVRG